MGCAPSTATASTGASAVKPADGSVLLQSPQDWVAGIRLMPAAGDAMLAWCAQKGAMEMGDLAFATDVAILQSVGESNHALTLEVQQMKLKHALSGLAAAIHADSGSWPQWGIGGDVDLTQHFNLSLIHI